MRMDAGRPPLVKEDMSRFVVPLALALALASAAAANGDEAGLAAEGREVALRACTRCHIVAEEQARRPVMRPPAPDFAGVAARPGVTEAYLRDFFMKPHGRSRRVRATPASLMSGHETDAVIAYILSLKASDKSKD